jgi:hypothetical protein
MPLIKENVIICGIIKNCGRTLSSNMERCVETGGLFDKCKIVIYENNSTDNTKEVLNLLKINQTIKVISEDIPMESIKKNSRIWAYTAITGSDHPCRIEQISNARNKVLEEINKPDYDEYKYVIWIDLDSAGWDINGIYDSFKKKSNWDIVYANGQNSGGGFYDRYAFRDSTHLFGPEITGEYFWNHLPTLNFNKETKLIPVYSSFGGVGIYKKEIFKQIKYDCIVNSDMKKFYNNIFKNNTLQSYCDKIDKTLYNIVCSEDSKFFGGEKDDVNNIFWKNNSGYNNLVICEHVCFNLAAINAGYKIFINPKMVYKWV